MMRAFQQNAKDEDLLEDFAGVAGAVLVSRKYAMQQSEVGRHDSRGADGSFDDDEL